ncbi:MAG: penicillin-binding protein 2 [Acidimicrobiia bacterium]|nr:penicillin-binding protein 2 [Acidimicrobiia bacterium]
MNGPIRRVSLGIYLLFLVLLGSVTWIQVLSADTYRDHPRNVRTNLNQTFKERGLIVTSDGVVLARSVADEEDSRRFTRTYPEGEVFANLTGYASLFGESTGAEAAFDGELRSRQDATFSDMIAALLGRDLRPHSVQLTVDANVQRVAYESLGSQHGAVVVLQPDTGNIIAAASTPSYDPNSLIGVENETVYDELLADPDNPLLDRATRENFPPGSTFKPIVAAAAIDAGVAEPDTTFPDPQEFDLPGTDATIGNFGDGVCADGDSITLRQAMIVSCNTVFADLAIQTGAETIGLVAEPMGFNDSFSIPWQTAESNFPIEALEEDDAALGQSGIGERNVRATPLQMAVVAATIANDGEMVAPGVLRQLTDADGETITERQVPAPERTMSPETADILTDMMEQVITAGSGQQAAIPGIRVAGKTGTATGVEDRPSVWFIAFAPVEDPTHAIAVLVEEGGEVGEGATGGNVAAPIAARVLEEALAGN